MNLNQSCFYSRTQNAKCPFQTSVSVSRENERVKKNHKVKKKSACRTQNNLLINFLASFYTQKIHWCELGSKTAVQWKTFPVYHILTMPPLDASIHPPPQFFLKKSWCWWIQDKLLKVSFQPPQSSLRSQVSTQTAWDLGLGLEVRPWSSVPQRDGRESVCSSLSVRWSFLLQGALQRD